jgi:hypothetical protein
LVCSEIATNSFSSQTQRLNHFSEIEPKPSKTARSLFCSQREGAQGPSYMIILALGRGEKVSTPVGKYSNYSSCSKRQKKTKPPRFELRPLSIEELCKVDLATFREGVNHRRWPKEVIEQFLAVQV